MKLVLLSTMMLTFLSCGDYETKTNSGLDLDDKVQPMRTPIHSLQAPALKAERLEAFASQDEFNLYVDALTTRRQHEQGDGGTTSGCPNCDADSPVSAAPVSAAPGSIAGDAESSTPGSGAADSITNNQEVGVDEGGIVKLAGDYLIVLLRGRLFSIRVLEEGQPRLLPVAAVNAFPEHHSTSTWYDELLIHDNTILVIGYSYGYGATEIATFELADDGTIHHRSTNFLRSNDYYSSRNYASRLIGDQLVFYMPYNFYQPYDREHPISLPGQAQLLPSGEKGDWDDIIRVTSIIKPIEEISYPVLHSIITCDLSSDAFLCNATGIIGPSSRNFYVSASSVYLWTSEQDDAHVYRIKLDDGRATAIRAQGSPIDQFSFKETKDDQFHVLVREYGNGEGMWSAELSDGALALLSLPLSRFSTEPSIAVAADYALLQKPQGYRIQNRFIGDHILYGSEKGWEEESDYKRVSLYNITSKVTTELALSHDVERIEGLGNHALIVGSSDTALAMSVIDFDNTPKVTNTFAIPGASQGERRSHGFFFKPTSEESGYLGLPLRDDGNAWNSLAAASSSIKYLEFANHELRDLGDLVSNKAANLDDACVASCVDWYGNSRPIFFRDRIFGLMGYDLVEGILQGGKLSERQRINYMPTGAR